MATLTEEHFSALQLLLKVFTWLYQNMTHLCVKKDVLSWFITSVCYARGSRPDEIIYRCENVPGFRLKLMLLEERPDPVGIILSGIVLSSSFTCSCHVECLLFLWTNPGSVQRCRAADVCRQFPVRSSWITATGRKYSWNPVSVINWGQTGRQLSDNTSYIQLN